MADAIKEENGYYTWECPKCGERAHGSDLVGLRDIAKRHEPKKHPVAKKGK